MRYLYDILAWYEVQKQRAVEGQSLVEYGLILALIAVVAIVGLTAMGTRVRDLLDSIANRLNPAG